MPLGACTVVTEIHVEVGRTELQGQRRRWRRGGISERVETGWGGVPGAAGGGGRGWGHQALCIDFFCDAFYRYSRRYSHLYICATIPVPLYMCHYTGGLGTERERNVHTFF